MATTFRSKKAKGVRLEKEFSKMLVDAGLDPHAQRMIMSGAVKGFDGDILTKLPIHVEAKNQETWKPLEYYRQAETSNPSPATKHNLVVMSKNREDIFVFFKASDYIEILAWAIKGGFGS